MEKDLSPFATSSYIGPEHFCDREKETGQLTQAARQHYNYTIFSLRRMGKTGLISHVMHKLRKENVKCIYIDIMPTSNFEEFAREFSVAYFKQGMSAPEKMLKIMSETLRSFVPSLKSDPMTGGLEIELALQRRESLYDDIDRIFELIKNSGDTYLIAIDEFQQILNYPEKNTEAFLRSKIQFLNNTSFIFSGSVKHMLLSIFGEASRPFWQSSAFMELKPIDKDVYSEFIKDKFGETKIKIQREALDYIFEVTRGVTYYVQLICNRLWYKKIAEITIQDVKETTLELIEERKSYFVGFLNLLSERQLETARAIAREDGVEQITSSAFLNKYRLASSAAKTAVKALIDKEIVYRDDDKTYRITDPFFSHWMRRR